MEFTEATAQQICADFDLKTAVIAVWRTRKKIPDKYNAEALEILNRKIKITEGDKKKLLLLIYCEKINLKIWAKLAEIGASKIADVKRGKASFSDQDFFSMKIALQKVRVNIKNSLEKLSNKNYFSDNDYNQLRLICKEELIVLEIILSFKLSNSQRGKIRDFVCEKSTPLSSDVLQVIDCFAVFILETAL